MQIAQSRFKTVSVVEDNFWEQRRGITKTGGLKSQHNTEQGLWLDHLLGIKTAGGFNKIVFLIWFGMINFNYNQYRSV